MLQKLIALLCLESVLHKVKDQKLERPGVVSPAQESACLIKSLAWHYELAV